MGWSVRLLATVTLGVALLALPYTSRSSADTLATFGLTSVGSSTDSPTAGYKFGSIYSLSGSGSAVSFSWYTRGGSADQRFVPVVYTVSGGAPAGLLAKGAETVVRAGQPAGWVTSTLPAVDLHPGNYLLGLLAGPTSHGAVTYYTPTPGTNYWNANAYPTPSSTWGTVNVSGAAWSAYVSYQPTGSSTGPPVAQTPPAATGSAPQNSVEATDNGSWTNSPTGYTYKWQRESSPGSGTYSDIAGETANRYVARGADLGLRIRAGVSASNGSGSATAYSNPLGPVTKLTRFADDFNRANGALGLPWASASWAKGDSITPTISGNRSIDASGTHQGAVSHLLGGPFSGTVKLRIMVPSKYNGPSGDGRVGSSDVALDYGLDLATGRGYRWQIDSDSGAYLRLWKHSAATSGYTPVAGPWPYKLVSGQGLWVEYNPSSGVHRVGVVEATGTETLVATAVDKTYTSGYAGFGLEVTGSTSSQVDDFVLEQS